MYGGVTNTTRRLLGLPNGIHFRELNLSWHSEENLLSVGRLVAACGNTLECLNIVCAPDGEIHSDYPLDHWSNSSLQASLTWVRSTSPKR